MENIFTQIETLCQDRFEQLWIKEVDRITTIWCRFLLYADTRSKTSSESPHRMNDYDFRFDDFAVHYLFPDKTQQRLNEYERDHKRDFCYMLRGIDKKGIEVYLSERKGAWYKTLTSKLNKYLKTMLLESDEFVTGATDNSKKGYTIKVFLKRDNKTKLFETMCFPAGGTNIQCFHYRYKGIIK